MEDKSKQREVLQIVLKTLDELKFKYDKSKEELKTMFAYHKENEDLYDGTVRNTYNVPFFMEYNSDFGETQDFTAIVDASTMNVISIRIAHGNLEIIYDSNGKAKKTKFISPSFPYDKQ